MPEWVEPPPVSREEAATRAPTVAVRGRSRPVADLLEAGAVVAIHSGGLYKVEIESRDAPVLARLGGETLKRRFRVVAGDHVTVELTLHDSSRGRIVRRL